MSPRMTTRQILLASAGISRATSICLVVLRSLRRIGYGIIAVCDECQCRHAGAAAVHEQAAGACDDCACGANEAGTKYALTIESYQGTAVILLLSASCRHTTVDDAAGHRLAPRSRGCSGSRTVRCIPGGSRDPCCQGKRKQSMPGSTTASDVTYEDLVRVLKPSSCPDSATQTAYTASVHDGFKLHT